MNVHFSSKTDDWATPDKFFQEMVHRFGEFDLDLCASPENAKAPKFFTKEDDGLKQAWHGKVWMNPPYGREINKWMAKAYQASVLYGATVVCLVPARTDTAWWHDLVIPHAKIEFIRGRLKFGDAKNSAPFPSALVIYNGWKGDKGHE